MMCAGIRQTRTPRDAIAYFRSARDHSGRKRDHEPTLLHGYPDHFVRLGDSLSGQINFCCTGVWAIGAEPRDEQLVRIRKVFTRTVLPGLAPERLAAVYYYHDDHGHSHVHFAVMGLDLESGARFSPYVHKLDRNRFRLLSQLINDTEGLPDPNNPANCRLVMPPPVKSDEEYLAEHRAICMDIEAIVRNSEIISPDGVCYALEQMGWRARRDHRALKVARTTGDREVTIYGAVTRQKVFVAANYIDPYALEWDWQHLRARRLRSSAEEFLVLHRKRATYNRDRFGGTPDDPSFESALESLAQGALCAPGLFGPAQEKTILAASAKQSAANGRATENVVPPISVAPTPEPARQQPSVLLKREPHAEPIVNEDAAEFFP